MVEWLKLEILVKKDKVTRVPIGIKCILFHKNYEVKNDSRHRARLVGGGLMSNPNTKRLYQFVVTLRGIRFIVILAELNSLHRWVADVGIAY
jgi:predicted transcriptional regulator